MRWFNDGAAEFAGVSGASINIGDSNERLPPGWARPRIVACGIHHAPHISASATENRVGAEGAGIYFATIPAEQPAVEIPTDFLVRCYELVPEEFSMFSHITSIAKTCVSLPCGLRCRRNDRVHRVSQRKVARVTSERRPHLAGDVRVADAGLRIGEAEGTARSG